MTAPRLDLAADLRNLVACAGEGHDIDRQLRRTLGDLPEDRRPTVERFCRLYGDILAGHPDAVEDYMGKEPGELGDPDGAAIWRTVALDNCRNEFQDVIDLALGGWSVWSVPLRPEARRGPGEMWDRLTQTAAEEKAKRARDWGGEVNVTFVAVEPGQTPAVAA